MNIAFVHYHLKPGGVTRVIQQQIEICKQMGWGFCILAGENPLDLPNTRVIPELHYDLHRSGLGNPAGGENPALLLADQMEREIRSAFGCPPAPQASNRENPEQSGESHSGRCADIIHVHNATLAKNSDLLPAVEILQSRGNRLFLQLHDFAEDGRPTVYSSSPYPSGAHYGFINSRDGEFLSDAGVVPARLHAIPNLISPLPGAIPADESLPDDLFAKPSPAVENSAGRSGSSDGTGNLFALYPVRGIRRKNLGEALLLSIILKNTEIGITLEPNNPADRPSYDFWTDMARQTAAPITFNLARKMRFDQALERADYFISTSVQEGFGFTFLEPWTLGKAVAGRKIPYVHRDFTAEGMRMDWFYDEIPVPVSLIDVQSFRALWLAEAERRLSRFRIALRNQNLDDGARRTQELTEELPLRFHELYGETEAIDFGRLDQENQARVVIALSGDESLRELLIDRCPVLSAAPFTGRLENCREAVRANHQRVYSAYGSARYSGRLEAIYRAAAADRQPSTQAFDKQALLFSFLDPAQIFLISSL